MTIGSTIKIQMQTSQTEDVQASDISVRSNANYSARVSKSTAALYEYTVNSSSVYKDLNVYSDTDLLGTVLAFSKVLGVHIENEGGSTVKIDGTRTTVPIVYGDFMIPKQGAVGVHNIYGYDVVYGSHDVISIHPGVNGDFTIRILGER